MTINSAPSGYQVRGGRVCYSNLDTHLGLQECAVGEAGAGRQAEAAGPTARVPQQPGRGVAYC